MAGHLARICRLPKMSAQPAGCRVDGSADDPKSSSGWLLVVRRVRHAFIEFALIGGALEALFLHQLAAPLHHLTMAAAVAGEGGSRIDREESEPEKPNDAEVDCFANDALLKHGYVSFPTGLLANRACSVSIEIDSSVKVKSLEDCDSDPSRGRFSLGAVFRL
jgi:hypothetical protein